LSVPERKSPAASGAPNRAWIAAGAAWLVPGLGHLLVGRRARALLFGAVVLGTLVTGLALHGNLYRVLPDQPLTLLGTFASMGVGAVYFVVRLVAGYQGDPVALSFEYGTAFVLTAGLMNLLLVLDAWDIACGRKE
jgi:hypothetical protein